MVLPLLLHQVRATNGSAWRRVLRWRLRWRRRWWRWWWGAWCWDVRGGEDATRHGGPCSSATPPVRKDPPTPSWPSPPSSRPHVELPLHLAATLPLHPHHHLMPSGRRGQPQESSSTSRMWRAPPKTATREVSVGQGQRGEAPRWTTLDDQDRGRRG